MVFNYFVQEARASIELPALWVCLYMEEGQEKLDLGEPTYYARVAEIKEREKAHLYKLYIHKNKLYPYKRLELHGNKTQRRETQLKQRKAS